MNALGNKDGELSQVIDASNAVFRTFAEQDQSFQRTLRLLPGALSKTRSGLGKLATAAGAVGPALRRLEPFATALAPAEEASRSFFKQSAPIFEQEIRPFARQVLPVVNQLEPSLGELGEAFPGLTASFSVFNEFFNELAYNPGPNQGGFMFFLDWANHDANSALSSADAHGPLGRALVYLNCEVLPLLKGASEVNQSVRILVALLKPPTGAECQAQGLTKAAASGTSAASAAAARARTHTTPGHGFTMRLLGSRDSAFGRLAAAGGGGR